MLRFSQFNVDVWKPRAYNSHIHFSERRRKNDDVTDFLWHIFPKVEHFKRPPTRMATWLFGPTSHELKLQNVCTAWSLDYVPKNTVRQDADPQRRRRSLHSCVRKLFESSHSYRFVGRKVTASECVTYLGNRLYGWSSKFLSAVLILIRLYSHVKWSLNEYIGYRSRGPKFDSPRYRISWEVVGVERGPLSLVSITEELLEQKTSNSRWGKPRLTAVGIRCADHALTWPRSSNRSVGIVRLRTKPTEFF
jgi:hypothetical protein